MGINDVYSQARENILMMNPLPNINVAYSPILQDESHRKTYISGLIPTDSSSFMVSNVSKKKFHKNVQKTLGAMPNFETRSFNYPRLNNHQ